MGLMKTAIRKNSPTLLFESASLYRSKGEVPEGEVLIPLGKAGIMKEGSDVTVVAVSAAVPVAVAAARNLEEKGISVEVIDPRTLVPLDSGTILDSVRKTGKLVTVENSWRTCGIGAEIAAMVSSDAYDHLRAPIFRVALRPIPEPFSPPLMKQLLINENHVIEAVMKIVRKEAAS
jgi:pyruvate dehydrogenase E1 component beta subunit